MLNTSKEENSLLTEEQKQIARTKDIGYKKSDNSNKARSAHKTYLKGLQYLEIDETDCLLGYN